MVYYNTMRYNKRVMVSVDERVRDELARLKREHGGATFGTLILHLILEHDIAQDRRERRAQQRLVRIPELEDEALSLGKEGWEAKYGTPEQNANIMVALGLSPEVVMPYVPHFGNGRPKGAKDIKQRKRRTRAELAMAGVK